MEHLHHREAQIAQIIPQSIVSVPALDLFDASSFFLTDPYTRGSLVISSGRKDHLSILSALTLEVYSPLEFHHM